MSRRLTDNKAPHMINMGFIEPSTKELPKKYTMEMNRFIKFEMEDSMVHIC